MIEAERASRKEPDMGENPLTRLSDLGQSIWMDFLQRGTITSGGLRRYIEDDGVRGVTSNPAIFEKAISGSPEYDAPIQALARAGKSAADIYQAITIEDIQLCADAFRPLFERLEGADGFVSLEVAPELAHDTSGTIAEARRLWKAVDRPNLMIKVPGTAEGLPAIQSLIAEGINVNITLLFGLDRYEQVANAYLAALEQRVARGAPVRVASVASFFLSRIDVMVDAELDERVRAGKLDEAAAARLRGQVAIACARGAFTRFERLFGGERWRKLAAQGARPQRLLWASTGTKNKADSDVKYVEPLIGAGTINTVPKETLDAYRDHGEPQLRLGYGLDEAAARLDELGRAGIDLTAITERLEADGVKKFTEAHTRLLAVIEKRRAAATGASTGADRAGRSS
jgi:transaldolase/glucose-6-phosphate isomerase